MTKLEKTLQGIDALHAQDPKKVSVNGVEKADELVYAENMSNALKKVFDDPSEELQIAVRSQHLCRWEIARSEYPMDRPGYLKWRTDLGKLHADKAAAVMAENDYSEESIDRTRKIIRKQNLKANPEAQAMEDSACLVFIDTAFLDFAKKYPEEKVIDIVQKTWNKMSTRAQEEALKLDLTEEALNLVKKALS
ncbi:MAG: DUF4202 domain-containing protein [Lentisphaeraceae bacterium]|nr:DUF4202 domain-containing protein [Lentisphaeraceae bacterium]